MSDRINVGADPAWAGAFSNLVNLFDPKVAAEGAALQARRSNWEADARKSGLEADAVALRLGALKEMPIGMNPIAYWAAKAASASTPDSIVGGNTRQGAYDAAMTGDAEAARRANNYLHGADRASAGPSGIMTVDPITGKPSLQQTPYSQSMTQENQARAALNQASAAYKEYQQKNPKPVAKPAAVAGSGQERLPFTAEQLVGPVRQQIVDLYHAGSKDTGDFKTLDEGMINRISQTAQALVSSGVSSRSSALADAFAVNGFSTDANQDSRFTVQSTTVDNPGLGTGDAQRVTGITPVPQPFLGGVDETTRLLAEGQIVPEAVGASPIHTVPVERIGDMLPLIRDQAAVGDQFRIGNKLYQKVQMRDGSFALIAI